MVEGWIISSTYDSSTLELIFALENAEGKEIVRAPALTNPFFFCLEKDKSVVNTVSNLFKQSPSFVKGNNELQDHRKDIYQVFVQNPELVDDIREKLIEEGVIIYLADVPFKRVNQIIGDWDNYIKVENGKITPLNKSYVPRVLFWDIETRDTSGEPDPKKDPIRCIGTQIGFFCEKEEKDTIRKFLDVAIPYSIWVEFSGSGLGKERFDFPYFKKRCEILGIQVPWFTILPIDWSVLYTSGIGITGYRKPIWNSLDFVGKKEVGLGKIPRHKKIEELFQAYLKGKGVWCDKCKCEENLKIYNTRDWEIVEKVEKKFGFVRILIGRKNMSGADMSKCQYSSVIIDSAVLREAYKTEPRLVLPCKGQGEGDEFKSGGGFVFDPIIGRHKNVMVLDVVSMYNMIVQIYNLSPETYDPNGDIKTPFGNFRSKPKGVYPKVLEKLTKRRNKNKALRDSYPLKSDEWQYYDYEQLSDKTVLLTAPGILGQKSSRVCSPQLAEAVPGLGRLYITSANKAFDRLNARTLYGDTDSQFLKFPDNLAREEVVKQSFELAEEMRKVFDQILIEHGISSEHLGKMQIEPDMLYDSLILYNAKKRRAGLYSWKAGVGFLPKPELHVMGLETIRSTTVGVLKGLQNDILMMILNFDSREIIETKKGKVYQMLMNGELDNELVISKAMSMPIDQYKWKNSPPPHVRAAIKLEREHGYKVPIGEKIRFYYSSVNPLTVEPYIEDKPIVISHSAREHYWNSLIVPNIDKLTEAAFPQDSIDEWTK